MCHRSGKALRLFMTVVLVVLFVPALASTAPAPQRYIVTFDGGAVNARALQAIERLGGAKIKDLPIVDGAVVYLPSKAAAQAVAALAGVRTIEVDAVVQALAKPAPVQPVEVLPWGIDRIDAEQVWSAHTGVGIKVGIIDTGIDTAHPDLVDNIKGGVSTVSYTTKYTDDNGHGTHVAGTVAAVDNTIGVIGVAPQASLYAIKVLDRRGSGYVSDIEEGLQWAIDNGMNVVNMSLGTSTYVASFDVAVQKALAAGVVVVAAAGNSGPYANTVGYPAKFSGVIGVGATDSSDAIASFSSRGPQVDVAAPGVSVYSTYKGGKYSTLSGTSMASPHVAGVASLVLQSPIGADDADGDGVWDPSEVEARIERTALDLGVAGFDNNFGNGLVRANLAVAP